MFGCIEGFEDLGSHGSTSSIAYCTIVLMLCGLGKKWKQLAVYYLNHGNIKSEVLVSSLLGILYACHSAGL